MKQVMNAAGIAGAATFLTVTLGVDFVVITDFTDQMRLDLLKITVTLFVMLFLVMLWVDLRS